MTPSKPAAGTDARAGSTAAYFNVKESPSDTGLPPLAMDCGSEDDRCRNGNSLQAAHRQRPVSRALATAGSRGTRRGSAGHVSMRGKAAGTIPRGPVRPGFFHPPERRT